MTVLTFTQKTYGNRMAMPELSEQERNWYILKGYEIIESHGTRHYQLNSESHREDGPAIEWSSGARFWFQYNFLHREDGPAVIHSDGSYTWYLHGKVMTEEEHRKAVSETKNVTA